MLLLFVWLIIFTSYSNADDSSEGSDGEFFANVFNYFPESDDICPCTPRGEICDILATCQRDACLGELDRTTDECDDLDCFGLEVGPLAVLFCGNDPDEDLEAFLFTPLFATIGPFFPGFGICVSSYDGIAGVIRAVFEFIEEFIDQLEDCFDDDRRRRLQHGTTPDTSDTATNPDPSTPSSPFHGSAVAFENFVQILEWNGNDRQELWNLISQEGGIIHLAGMMKQKATQSAAAADTTPADTTTATRRLLDSGEDSGSDICDFGFLFAFLGSFLRRRRLSVETPFDPALYPFESLLSTLYSTADCENNRDATPILCILHDTLNKRRRLESEDGDGDDGDFNDFGCCGDIGTNIQFTSAEQVETCGEQIEDSASSLNALTDGCVDR